MRNLVELTILGEPFGKQRPRVIARGKGASRAFTPQKAVNYENYIKLLYRQKYKNFKFEDKVPLYVQITAFYKIPPSKPKYIKGLMFKGEMLPTKKPDVDNIIKIILDSLNGLAYKDDAQIVACSCQKFYASNPRVELVLSKVNEVELGEIKEGRKRVDE